MPYIKQERREELDNFECDGKPAQFAGELNYQLTKECIRYFKGGRASYQRINDVLGALEGAKMEFYRRIASKYEDSKIRINGDVYPL